VQAAVFEVDPGVAVSDAGVLSAQLRDIRRVYLLFGSVFTTMGGIVLLLSMMATFAVLSFEVTRRVREIGIRIALGADRAAIIRSVLGRVGIYVAAGSVVGTVIGALLLRGARAMLVMRFPLTGVLTFPLLMALATASALVAAWLPARRALAIRPMEAMRAD
jgi:ABC-type antimicrobial peptide transport system permease subunit